MKADDFLGFTSKKERSDFFIALFVIALAGLMIWGFGFKSFTKSKYASEEDISQITEIEVEGRTFQKRKITKEKPQSTVWENAESEWANHWFVW